MSKKLLEHLIENVIVGEIWEPINTDYLDGYTEFQLQLENICPPSWTEVMGKVLKQLNSEYVNPIERFHTPHDDT